MSAAPAIEQYLEAPAATLPAPLVQPRVAPRPRVIARPQPKANVMSEVLSRSMVFAFFASAAFLGTTLGGHVMVEKARREGIRAVERSFAASRDATSLRQRVEVLTSEKSIEDWARLNGFVASDLAAKPSSEGNHAQLKD